MKFSFKLFTIAAACLMISNLFAAPNAGYITSITYTTGKNGLNYAVIGTSAPQQVPGSQNYVGGESSGLYTLVVLPSDPSLMAVAASTLERCRGVTTTKFYYLNPVAGANSSLADVPIRGGSDWINLITTWWVGL